MAIHEYLNGGIDGNSAAVGALPVEAADQIPTVLGYDADTESWEALHAKIVDICGTFHEARRVQDSGDNKSFPGYIIGCTPDQSMEFRFNEQATGYESVIIALAADRGSTLPDRDPDAIAELCYRRVSEKYDVGYDYKECRVALRATCEQAYSEVTYFLVPATADMPEDVADYKVKSDFPPDIERLNRQLVWDRYTELRTGPVSGSKRPTGSSSESRLSRLLRNMTCSL